MDKVYVVQGSFGSWDDYREFLIGIYSNPHDADECKRKFIAEVQSMSSLYTKEDIEKYEELSDEPSDMWCNETKEYVQWAYSKEYTKFNLDEVVVKEYPLNSKFFDPTKTFAEQNYGQ